jgi:hypothetical protein
MTISFEVNGEIITKIKDPDSLQTVILNSLVEASGKGVVFQFATEGQKFIIYPVQGKNL